MGSWNSTCALSNLPIKRGDKVVFLAIAENILSHLATGITSLWAPVSLPLYAKYDDLGSIEQWSKSESAVLDLALDYFKQNIVPCTVRMAGNGADAKVEKETLTFEELLAALREGVAKVPLYHYGNAKCVSILIRRDVWNSLLEMEIPDFLSRPQSLARLKAGVSALLEDVQTRAANANPKYPFLLMRDVYECASCPLQRSISGHGGNVSPQFLLLMDLRTALAEYGLKPTATNQKHVELLLTRHMELATIGYVMEATRRCWQPTSGVGFDSNFEVHRAFQTRVAKITAELEQKENEDCL